MTNGKTSTRILELAAVSLSLLVITSKCAHAYIDPGTGSYVLQAAVASILAAAFVFKSKLRQLSQAVCRLFVKRPKDGE